ncbi:hypothetical protein DRN87_00575 [Candidatus Geothermarchaeota archaeon]|nr:MAG: hypothetical protein DRN87_00575 [Candidatus Geothermarchaeota archaeon]HEW93894.1 hypothetical protein [Thermoprotei archaeon]
MFSAIIDKEKIKRWIKIATTLEKLTDEACFWISPDGILFREMDTARISMIDMMLEKDYFLTYEYTFEDEEIPICMQSDKLLAFSKLMKNAEEMEFILPDDKTHFILKARAPYEKRFGLPIVVATDKTKTGIPNLDYSARIRLVTTTLRDIVKEAKTVSDRLTLVARDNEISFISKSEEGFEASHKLVYPDNVEIVDMNISEESIAVYMVKPILDIVKEIAGISGIVKLNFGTNQPLNLQFEMIEFEYYQYFLAPRTEE